MDEEPQTIAELEFAIREFINEPRKRQLLRKRPSDWSQICSSLDAIGDTLLAIDAFPIGNGERHKGTLYLWIYGLLQACFLQQDAIGNLAEALQLEDSYKDYPELLKIRELRNDAVGHPTKRRHKPPYCYCSISRVSLSTSAFQMMIEDGDCRAEFRNVTLSAVVSDQKAYAQKLLASVLAKLQRELREHKEQFKMAPLTALFPETLGYAFEKVSQGIFESGPDSHGHAAFGLSWLESIERVLRTVQEALVEREFPLDAHSPIGYLYEQVDYPITKLRVFLEAKKTQGDTPIDDKTASIHEFFLRKKCEELRELAAEIDADYAS